MKKSLLAVMLVAIFLVVGCGGNDDYEEGGGDDGGEEITVEIGDGEEQPIGGDMVPPAPSGEVSPGEDGAGEELEPVTIERPTRRRRGGGSDDSELTVRLSPRLPDAVVDVEYNKSIGMMFSGGDRNYTITADDLPSGLSFNAGTRRISGVPTSVGHYEITFNVTDGEGATASATSRMTVKDNIALNVIMVTPNGDEEVISDDDWEETKIDPNAQMMAKVTGMATNYRWKIYVNGSEQNVAEGAENAIILPEGTSHEQHIRIKVEVADEYGSNDHFSGTFLMKRDRCLDDVKVRWSATESRIEVTGGKGPYIWNNLKYSITKYDYDGNVINGSGLWIPLNYNEPGYTDVGELEIPEYADQDASGGFLTVNTPALIRGMDNATSGYDVNVKVDIQNSCPESDVTHFEHLVEGKRYEMDVTLDDLYIQCDFEDITHVNNAQSTNIGFHIYVGEVIVAKAGLDSYKLNECEDGKEYECEKAVKFEHNGGKMLTEYSINDITEFRIRMHKSKCTAGLGNTQKFDIDMIWCKLFTQSESKDNWYAIYYDGTEVLIENPDFQEEIDEGKFPDAGPDHVNQNEAGGTIGRSGVNAKKYKVLNEFLDYPNIWKPVESIPEQYDTPIHRGWGAEDRGFGIF